MNDAADNPNPNPWVRWFLAIGRLETASFVVLLGIAMPLKYAAGMPMAVRYVGWIHGLLFLGYGLALIGVARTCKLGLARFMLGGVMALLPFGPIWLEGRWRARGVLERR